MITKRKIEIYNKFGGLEDGFIRVGTKHDKEIFQTEDWYTIANMLQDLDLIKNDLCSTDFKRTTLARLGELFDLEARELLKKRFLIHE